MVGPPYGSWEPQGPAPGATYPTSLHNAAGICRGVQFLSRKLFPTQGGAPRPSQGPDPGPDPGPPPASSADPLLLHPDTWRVPHGTGAGGSGTWLTRVTPVLLGLAADPNLRLMRQLVRAKGEAVHECAFRNGKRVRGVVHEQGRPLVKQCPRSHSPSRSTLLALRTLLQVCRPCSSPACTCTLSMCATERLARVFSLFCFPECLTLRIFYTAVQASFQPDVCEAIFPALLQDLATAGAARDPDLPFNLARQIERHVLGPLQPPTANSSSAGGARALSTATPLPVGANAVGVGAQGYPTAAGGDVYGSNGQLMQGPTHGSGPAAAVVRVAQIVLRAMEHLRCLHTRIVRERKPNHQVRPGSTSANSSHRLRAAAVRACLFSAYQSQTHNASVCIIGRQDQSPSAECPVDRHLVASLHAVMMLAAKQYEHANVPIMSTCPVNIAHMPTWPQAARANAALAAKGPGAAAATPGRADGRPAWELAVDGWDRVYGLDIDYLLVARVRNLDGRMPDNLFVTASGRVRTHACYSRACYSRRPQKLDLCSQLCVIR